jgi:hypothetical protein
MCTSIPIVINDNTGSKVIGRHYADPKSDNETLGYSTIAPTKLENGYFLYFNQTNVAHSLCQFIISYYEIITRDKNPKLYVSQCILKLPLIHKLIQLLFNIDTFHTIMEDTLYHCENIFIPTYIWFYGDYVDYHEYDVPNNVRIFKPLERDDSQYKHHISMFNAAIDEIYHNNFTRYKTYDNIYIIKSQLCSDSTTPQRGMSLSHNVLDILNEHNYHMILPHKITDIIEFIVLLKSAKNIITSYGGAQCINRFFFTNGNIKVICNKSYKEEYKLVWHNVYCIYKSITTLLFMDINDDISVSEIKKIISYPKSVDTP